MAPGPVTDYGATMVHWMRNRQPRYKGGFQGETERPSPSYIIDVSSYFTAALVDFLGTRLDSELKCSLDASTVGESQQRRRLRPGPSLALVTK